MRYITNILQGTRYEYLELCGDRGSVKRVIPPVLTQPAREDHRSRTSLGESSGKEATLSRFHEHPNVVPPRMKTSLQHLSGIALMDTSCKPEVIWYFDEMELPDDLNERFRVLFQTREKWTLDEIRPYVQ
uniref:Sister chromatid cohesion protein DCC1 n=1 Tax=Timema monikensis TaxID=170555 RepID=A0A7R9E9A3_9NEOP|nr:unnamed protein product [Timema monikensis]